MIQSVRIKRKRRDSEDGDGSPDADEDIPEVSTRLYSVFELSPGKEGGFNPFQNNPWFVRSLLKRRKCC